ncbi:MAG: hypothetical protein WCP21_19105, partial [Armatimonadota bacterium]
METSVPKLYMGRVLAVIAVAIGVAALGGCAGALQALSGKTAGAMLPISDSYMTSLCDLEPVASDNWVTAPSLGRISINGHVYDPAVRGEVNGDNVQTCSVNYHLGGQYSALGAVFGVTDDEPDTPSWTAFRFWGDGRELAVPHYVK